LNYLGNQDHSGYTPGFLEKQGEKLNEIKISTLKRTFVQKIKKHQKLITLNKKHQKLITLYLLFCCHTRAVHLLHQGNSKLHCRLDSMKYTRRLDNKIGQACKFYLDIKLKMIIVSGIEY
jgi:hypothetical protein